MNEQSPKPKDEALLTRLLRTSGRGPTASPQARARVYAAVRARWQASLPEPRNHWRFTRRIALAAGLAAVAVVVYRLQTPQSELPPPFASIARVEGEVAVRHVDDAQRSRARASAGVRIGDTLTTEADGKVALRLENGYALRLSSSSEMVVVAENHIELRSGTIYFDSGNLGLDDPLTIDTAIGAVRHAGTQFEASLVDSRLRIRVREGTVVFVDQARELVASAGEQMHVGVTGAPERTTLAADDAVWQWVEDLAALQAADEYPLPDVLAWISRETGREVRFADAATESRAQSAILYDLESLTPREALEVLRRTTAFTYRDADGVLLVTDPAR